MKPGDLVEVGVPDQEALIVGILMSDNPPEKHRNGMHFIQVLHQDKLKWWPAGYVRRFREIYQMD